MRKIRDLKGQRFGRLIVLKLAVEQRYPHKDWLCKCDCGIEKIVNSKHLLHGGTRSCGCLQKELLSEKTFKHGMVNTIEYFTWVRMKTRCYDKTHKSYSNYGGRGITICDSWLESFNNFFADMGYRPDDKHSIERIDNDRDYTPENCKWGTWHEQAINRRTVENTTSKYRGVSWNKRGKKWHASIKNNCKSYYLGSFDLEETAAQAYDIMARELFGTDFRHFNEIT